MPGPPWSWRSSGLTALGVTLALAAGAMPALAKGTPDLVVTEARLGTTTAPEGGTIVVSHKVKNVGASAAGASTTRFYLTRDVKRSLAERKVSRTDPRTSPYDTRLIGERDIAKVPGGRSREGKAVELTIPVGTAPGRYAVLACADDLGTVAEKNEAGNCADAGTFEVVAPDDADALDLGSFADSYLWPEDETFSVEMIKAYCDATVPAKQLTLAAALKSTRRFLVDGVGTDALRQLDSSGLTDTPASAQELAAAGVTGGAPALGLAALLDAHGLEPRNGTHLLNAAALATSIGLPNQALAFLDAAQVLDFRRPPMGISHEAIALVTRGHALVGTARFPAARTAFLAAKAAEPLLSEADDGLATVEACTGDEDLAGRYVRRSRQRSQEEQPPVPPAKDPERPTSSVDIGYGKKTPLRKLPLAGTPTQAVAMHDIYQGLLSKLFEEAMEDNAETGDLRSRISSADEDRTFAEVLRRDSILDLVHQARFEEDIAPLDEEYDDALDRLGEHREEFMGTTVVELLDEAWAACEGSEDPRCVDLKMNSTCRPALAVHHSGWVDLMTEAQVAGDRLVAALSDRMSAYAANLGDPDAHRAAMLAIEEIESLTYYGLALDAAEWSGQEKGVEHWCVDPVPADVLATPARPDAQSSGACPDELKKKSFVAPLGPITFKMSCEETSIGFAADVLPLLQAFGEVSINARKGEITVVAGTQAEGNLGIVKGGFKSGIYLTSDLDGELTDVGWRVGPSVTGGAGPYEYELIKDEMDLSFIPRSNAGTNR